MIDKAVRMKPEHFLKKIPGDGNCFTRSVGEHMDLGHTDIRKRIIWEVQNNPGEYIDFLPQHELKNWSENMKKEGEWCDGLAVKAAANALKVPIVVFRKQSPDQSPSCFLPLPMWIHVVWSWTSQVLISQITNQRDWNITTFCCHCIVPLSSLQSRSRSEGESKNRCLHPQHLGFETQE